MSGEPPAKRTRNEEKEKEEECGRETTTPSQPVEESEERCLATVLEQLGRVQRVCATVLRSHVTSEERALAAKCAAEVAAVALAAATALNGSGGERRSAALGAAREGLEALRARVERERGRVGREVFGDLARPLVEGLLVPDDSTAAGRQVRAVGGAALRALRGRWGADVLAGALSHAARAGRLDFPWKRLTMGAPAALFAGVRTRVLARSTAPTPRVPGVALRRAAPEFVSLAYPHAGGAHLAFVSSLDDYFCADVLTDYFQEPVRLAARRRGQAESVLAQWRSGRAAFEAALGVIEDDVVEDDKKSCGNTGNGKPRDLNTFELREALYRRGVKECTLFKSTLARSVYDLYGARAVLDFSAGWGDRLIGAIAAPSVARYVGVDPNAALRAGHDAMRATLCPLAGKDAAAFTVVYAPFQTAALPALGAAPFDLVFTSPPFFDLELYTDDAHAAGQSVHDYPRYEQWAAHFLLAALRRAWGLLAPAGHMAIYITDVAGAPVVELMALYVAARLPRAAYTGTIISTGAAETPRPIWVWHKKPPCGEGDAAEAEADKARAARAEALLQSSYPRVVAELDKDS